MSNIIPFPIKEVKESEYDTRKPIDDVVKNHAYLMVEALEALEYFMQIHAPHNTSDEVLECAQVVLIYLYDFIDNNL